MSKRDLIEYIKISFILIFVVPIAFIIGLMTSPILLLLEFCKKLRSNKK